jgi:hypothetical protein
MQPELSFVQLVAAKLCKKRVVDPQLLFMSDEVQFYPRSNVNMQNV